MPFQKTQFLCIYKLRELAVPLQPCVLFSVNETLQNKMRLQAHKNFLLKHYLNLEQALQMYLYLVKGQYTENSWVEQNIPQSERFVYI